MARLKIAGNTRKKKKCNPSRSFGCGYSCQAIGRECRKPLKGQGKNSQEWLKLQAERLGKVRGYLEKRKTRDNQVGYAIGYSKKEHDSLPTEHLKKLYAIAAGLPIDLPPRTASKYDRAISQFNNANRKYQSPKIDLLRADGLSESEAGGVAIWINGNYKPINEAIYGGKAKETDYGVGAGIRAAEGLKRLDPYTHDAIVNKSGGIALLEKGTLMRGLSGVSDLDALLDSYRQSIGKEYKEPTFFATTSMRDSGFIDEAQVTFIVKSKSDGSGQGRFVDSYKNSLFEGEVVYPPFSRFKVTKVDATKPEYTHPKDGNFSKKAPAKILALSNDEWQKQASLHEGLFSEIAATMQDGDESKLPSILTKLKKLDIPTKGIEDLSDAYWAMRWADTKIPGTGTAKIYLEEI